MQVWYLTPGAFLYILYLRVMCLLPSLLQIAANKDQHNKALARFKRLAYNNVYPCTLHHASGKLPQCFIIYALCNIYNILFFLFLFLFSILIKRAAS